MRKIRIVGVLMIALLALLYGTWRVGRSRTFQFFGEIIQRVETNEKVVALTFDDGPEPGATEHVLAILRDRGVKASFYLMGSAIEQHPELARMIADEGHDIGNHTYSHKRMIFRSPSFIASEIERTDQLIREAGYTGEIHVRPPYCSKLVMLPYYLSRNQRKTITFDVEPDSYEEVAADSRKIVEHVLERARNGSIILLHVMYPSRKTSLEAVGGIIDGLRERGYEFRTVSELLKSRG